MEKKERTGIDLRTVAHIVLGIAIGLAAAAVWVWVVGMFF